MYSHDTECNYSGHIEPEQYYLALVAMEGALILPIVGSNLLVMASVYSFERLQTTGNMFAFNLAVSDFLIGAIFIPFDIWYLLYPDLTVNFTVCVLKYSLWYALLGTSLINLLLISFDRYIAICYPYVYSAHVRIRRVVCVCIMAWGPMTILALLPLFGYYTVVCPSPDKCDAFYIHNVDYRYSVFGILIFLLTLDTWLWMTVMGVAARQMLRIRQQQIAFMNRFSLLQTSQEQLSLLRRRNEKALSDARKTLVMVCVFILFVACWLPYLIGTALHFDHPGQSSRLLTNLGIAIASSHACINACVYGWKRREFRVAYRQLLCGKQVKKTDTIIPTSRRFGRILTLPRRKVATRVSTTSVSESIGSSSTNTEVLGSCDIVTRRTFLEHN